MTPTPTLPRWGRGPIAETPRLLLRSGRSSIAARLRHWLLPPAGGGWEGGTGELGATRRDS
jgi:hypothetical protein